MHKANVLKNTEQLKKRKDESSITYASQKIPAAELTGDSQWFMKRTQQMQQNTEYMALMDRLQKMNSEMANLGQKNQLFAAMNDENM